MAFIVETDLEHLVNGKSFITRACEVARRNSALKHSGGEINYRWNRWTPSKYMGFRVKSG